MPDSSEIPFVRRVVITVAVVLAAGALVALIWYAGHVLLLLFAGALFGVLLNGLASMLADRSPLPYKGALAVVGLVLIAIVVGLGFLIGPSVASQVGQFGDAFGQALGRLQEWLSGFTVGQALLANLPESFAEAASGSGTDPLASLRGAFSGAMGLLTGAVVILFTGAYFAINPSLYTESVVRLVPRPKRDRARDLFDALGMALRRWLLGQFFAMLLVGTLTTIGLLILGVPLALTLGILTFFLVFVPYVGSIVSGVLAVLIALLDSPQTALYAGLLYGGIQFIESYFITPMVQEKVVSIPPVLLIGSQFLLGVLAGGLGIALATPLAVAIVVVVQMLYVESVLGDDVEVMGTKGRY